MRRRSHTDADKDDADRRAALLAALKSLPPAPFWRTKEALLAACAARMQSTPTADDLTTVLRANTGLIGDIATDNTHGLYYQEHGGQRLYCKSDVHPRDFTGITLAACASLANKMATGEDYVCEAIEHADCAEGAGGREASEGGARRTGGGCCRRDRRRDGGERRGAPRSARGARARGRCHGRERRRR